MSVRQVAEAFSRHRFDEVYPYLHEGVRWTLVGDRDLVGRDAVVAACTQSAAYLAGVTSTFRRVTVVEGDTGVVVDCEVDYAEVGGTSRIASCDLYEFTDGRLTGITSYTVPLPGPAGQGRTVEVVPDGKDWTWVLERPCPECGLDTRTVDPADVAGLTRSTAADWAALLRTGRDVRTRPAPATWSVLEYGAHVRDVYRINDERLRLMLAEDDPLFPNWDQDATAVAERYGEQDPGVVAGELLRAADRLAADLDRVADWSRPGRRGDGARFTIATFARYHVHDPVHHYWDVTR